MNQCSFLHLFSKAAGTTPATSCKGHNCNSTRISIGFKINQEHGGNSTGLADGKVVVRCFLTLNFVRHWPVAWYHVDILSCVGSSAFSKPAHPGKAMARVSATFVFSVLSTFQTNPFRTVCAWLLLQRRWPHKLFPRRLCSRRPANRVAF